MNKNKYHWHRSKGLRAKQVVSSCMACPFFPVAPTTHIRVGLKEVALVKGEYKATGITLSTQVSFRAFSIFLGKAAHEVGVPDAAYNRRRWVIM